MDEEIIFKPIGYIKSPYEDVRNMPKSTRESGDVEAEMVINEEYLESMSSMEVGEEYMVLFYFHKSEGFKQRVPFMGNGPIKGLFSTHAPNRPNPIGVSTIKITGIDGNVIKFNGVDMLNGTPVLDINPLQTLLGTCPMRLSSPAVVRIRRVVITVFIRLSHINEQA